MRWVSTLAAGSLVLVWTLAVNGSPSTATATAAGEHWTLTILPTGNEYGINRSGAVACTTEPPGVTVTHACLWKAGQLTDLTPTSSVTTGLRPRKP